MSNSLVKWDAYIQIASQSDIGMRRMNNQDNFFVSLASTMDQWQRRGHLFIVADGMGAHAAGELASKIAVDHIPHLYAKFGGANPADSLRRAIIDANAEIHRRGQANEEFHNMGTTCSSMLLLPEGIYCGHVGDSRVYQLRRNRLDQLTFDHSLVWEMKATGQFTDDEDLIKIPKNVITRSLGPYAEIKVDMEGPFPVEVGDCYLLCTDGLTGQIADHEIGVILATLEPIAAAQLLIDVANLRGGPDNITVIVIKIIDAQIVNPPRQKIRSANDGRKRKPIVHPLSWAALLISLLVTALFYVINQSVSGAIVPAVVVVASLVWVLVQVVIGLNRVEELDSPRRYGRGPYISTDCEKNGWPLVKNMKEMIAQIMLAIKSGNLSYDDTKLQTLRRQADEAESQKNLSGTIRGFGRVISFLMEQLRSQGGNTTAID